MGSSKSQDGLLEEPNFKKYMTQETPTYSEENLAPR